MSHATLHRVATAIARGALRHQCTRREALHLPCIHFPASAVASFREPSGAVLRTNSRARSAARALTTGSCAPRALTTGPCAPRSVHAPGPETSAPLAARARLAPRRRRAPADTSATGRSAAARSSATSGAARTRRATRARRRTAGTLGGLPDLLKTFTTAGERQQQEYAAQQVIATKRLHSGITSKPRPRVKLSLSLCCFGSARRSALLAGSIPASIGKCIAVPAHEPNGAPDGPYQFELHLISGPSRGSFRTSR